MLHMFISDGDHGDSGDGDPGAGGDEMVPVVGSDNIKTLLATPIKRTQPCKWKIKAAADMDEGQCTSQRTSIAFIDDRPQRLPPRISPQHASHRGDIDLAHIDRLIKDIIDQIQPETSTRPMPLQVNSSLAIVTCVDPTTTRPSTAVNEEPAPSL
ncbi:hypothetical protein ACOSP7_026955 [Xanthoceras sorbifolium]